jgi:hypothetical protein
MGCIPEGLDRAAEFLARGIRNSVTEIGQQIRQVPLKDFRRLDKRVF